MPNWIEGTLKVRGSADKLIQFVKEAIEATVTEKQYGESDLEFDVPDRAYIADSRRAFTREACYCNIDKSVDNRQTIAIPIKQAWSFTPSDESAERWVQLAKKYEVDIRLQGFERGMEFYQDYAIENGEVTIDKVVEFDDWTWECPMPLLGG